MKGNLFSVYDACANRYHDTFTAPTAEYAKRAFAQLVNKPQHDFGLFAQDYSLFHVGTFDPETGLIEGINKTLVANATQLLVHPPFSESPLELEREAEQEVAHPTLANPNIKELP